jgi:hypothetical protein
MSDAAAVSLVFQGKPPPMPLADERVVRVRLRRFSTAILASGAVSVGSLAIPRWILRHGPSEPPPLGAVAER